MKKSIVILGAGPGLGIALARRYGHDGYSVALVARRLQPLQAISEQLSAEGVTVQVFTADFRNPEEVIGVLSEIQARFGSVDTLYYGPNAPETFVPASTLSIEAIKDKVELFLYGLVASVNAVLPSMRAQGHGAILVGLGGSASVGLPFMSGPGPALSGARNYLYSLYGELAAEGIYVGMLRLSAVIKNSGWQTGIQSGAIPMSLPPGFVIPEVDAAVLADMLYSAAHNDQKVPELVYPPESL